MYFNTVNTLLFQHLLKIRTPQVSFVLNKGHFLYIQYKMGDKVRKFFHRLKFWSSSEQKSRPKLEKKDSGYEDRVRLAREIEENLAKNGQDGQGGAKVACCKSKEKKKRLT